MNATSEAAQVILAIIPIVGIAVGGLVIFFWLLWHHREISLQIRTGTYRSHSFNFKIFCLLTGILLTGLGIVLTLLFCAIDGFTYELLGGLIPLSIGISLLIFYRLYPEPVKQDERS